MRKYERILNDLKRKIYTEFYPAHSSLPSEIQLQEEYSVSRDTIRKALSILTQQGYIQKVQGKGSIVIERDRFDFPVSELTSYKEVSQQLHIDTKTAVIELTELRVNAEFATISGFEEGIEVWKVVRIRLIDGIASVLDVDYFDKAAIPDLNIEIAKDSIYNYIEKTIGIEISYAIKEITVENSEKNDSILLNYDEPYLVVIRSKVYSNRTHLIQFNESRHRIDKFRFVDFARRKPTL